ncbi:response regulator [Flavilitoribacter nigricans]|uniref:Response regulatory domain-containing protein n=1 Tax=Flavilitoribacter nigricans (strain ATCC 23147 / DSM 23189 / NBRC 102662 / NCIMB 1420 / SS-2) TaxID=1122177 RepID=A0A2D0N9L0_FLAN2|nr:response regulator [Flavilitoribacter nigricans]PHN05202.1 hypothetical protein CRP01_16925 [Flavilitoribacter nigricans DSM 23189 = NBRC 102662]
MENNAHQLVKVVVVEDHFPDFVLIETACEQLPFPVQLTHFSNGLDLLHSLSPDGSTDLDFILLDLKNCVMDGRSFLRKIRALPAYQYLPIIVFSSSKTPSDVQSCLELGANAFVSKPLEYPEFARLIHSLFTFWNYNISL